MGSGVCASVGVCTCLCPIPSGPEGAKAPAQGGPQQGLSQSRFTMRVPRGTQGLPHSQLAPSSGGLPLRTPSPLPSLSWPPALHSTPSPDTSPSPSAGWGKGGCTCRIPSAPCQAAHPSPVPLPRRTPRPHKRELGMGLAPGAGGGGLPRGGGASWGKDCPVGEDMSWGGSGVS